ALICLFGKIDEVYCTSLRRVMARLEDTTTVLLSLANGISATLYCSLVTAPTYRFAVYGTRGSVELATPELEFRFTPVTERPATGRHPAPAPEIIGYKGFNALAAELEGFAAAINRERPYPITAEEVLHGVAAFDAIVGPAARSILVCNVPDYGTTEVADHAMALALSLRRGVILYHERQRQDPPAPWGPVKGELIRRLGVQTFGIIGLGRIGTAVALRARAFGFRVMFYDPHLPNGADLALGIARAPSLEDLLRQTDTLSIHSPLTPETREMLGRAQLSLLRKGAVVVNTARGPIIELDALLELLRDGHIAAAGLDVLPVEPP